MDDLIRRQAVKDILFNERGVRIYTHKGEKLKRYAEIDLDDFDAIPSAEPERKTGHWIEHENADIVDGYYVPKYECSCCHTWKHDDSDYCPDCGTKMCGTDGGEQE